MIKPTYTLWLISFDAINKLGQGFQVYLNNRYLDLKQKELILEYEYQSKRQQ